MAENKIGISGADYIIPPTTDHPFWEDGDIAENLTATATVDNSTGTPSVDVTKNGYNLNFDFKNLKGEKGDPGAAGEKGEKGDPGAPGASPKVEQIPGSLGVSGAPAVSITDPVTLVTGTVYNGEKGEKGEKGDTGAAGPQGPQGEVGPQGPQGEVGPQGPAGKDGSDADVSKCVTNVSVTSNSGTYIIKQTKGDGTTSNAGNIAIPNTGITDFLGLSFSSLLIAGIQSLDANKIYCIKDIKIEPVIYLPDGSYIIPDFYYSALVCPDSSGNNRIISDKICDQFYFNYRTGLILCELKIQGVSSSTSGLQMNCVAKIYYNANKATNIIEHGSSGGVIEAIGGLS